MQTFGSRINHGRRLREDWEDGPPKFEVGAAHVSAPNILRSSVIRCMRNNELSKKVVVKELFW